MRLSKVIITGYRSIQKTEELILDKKISILIGANDHGKTNLLHAIKCLNDNSPITEEERNWDLPDTDKVKIQWHLTVSQNFINKYEQAPI
jgi:predicted ATP-dependent endonuclease of OLD family